MAPYLTQLREGENGYIREEDADGEEENR